MSAIDLLKNQQRASRRVSLIQRRESLLYNRVSKFSKSMSTISGLTTSRDDIQTGTSPELRRCKSEEILSSWDHFTDSSLGLRNIPIASKLSTRRNSGIDDGNPTPYSSPQVSPMKRGKSGTIILESASKVTAGTIDSLVDHLTDLQYTTGTQYMEYFLFTYRYFMTADELLIKLGEIYAGVPPSDDLTPEELANYENLLPIRKLRVINVLKKWVENHVHDFSLDVEFIKKFVVFLDEVIAEDNHKWADHLKRIVEARILKSINEGKASDDIKKFTVTTVKLKNIQSLITVATLMRRSEIVTKRKKSLRTFKHSFYGNEALDWLSSTFQLSRHDALNMANQLLHAGFFKHNKDSGNKEKSFKDKNSLYICNSTLTEQEEEYPKPFRPKTTAFSFLDLHPIEVARQLTLIEFNLLEKITPQELSHQVWNKKNAKELSPNVTALIDRCNQVSYWVATEIVLTPNLKQRISILAKFIDIAEICHQLRNWNTLMELMVGLNLGCVTRLKKTWEGLPRNAVSTFENLTRLTSSSQNYLHYREALAQRELPFSPNLAVHLRDLTFIEDGNEDTVNDGLINFTKMQMLAQVFEEVHRLQSTRYHFKEIKAMSKYLSTGLYVIRTDKELYKASTGCEPSVRTMSMMSKSKSGRFLTLTRNSITKSI